MNSVFLIPLKRYFCQFFITLCSLLLAGCGTMLADYSGETTKLYGEYSRQAAFDALKNGSKVLENNADPKWLFMSWLSRDPNFMVLDKLVVTKYIAGIPLYQIPRFKLKSSVNKTCKIDIQSQEGIQELFGHTSVNILHYFGNGGYEPEFFASRGGQIWDSFYEIGFVGDCVDGYASGQGLLYFIFKGGDLDRMMPFQDRGSVLAQVTMEKGRIVGDVIGRVYKTCLVKEYPCDTTIVPLNTLIRLGTVSPDGKVTNYVDQRAKAIADAKDEQWAENFAANPLVRGAINKMAEFAIDLQECAKDPLCGKSNSNSSSTSNVTSEPTSKATGVSKIKDWGKTSLGYYGYDVTCNNGRNEIIYQKNNGEWNYLHSYTPYYVANANTSLQDAATKLCE